MTTYAIPNNIELNNIIYPRLSPYIWDIVGYCGGLVVIFYYNKIGIIAYSCLFVFYGALNIFLIFVQFHLSIQII